jgi:alpha-1,3-mannosyltransferase
MGELTLLAKDLYRQDLGKVLAVPAVNVAYSDEEAVGTRVMRGYVGDHVDQSRPSLARDEIVQWQSAPPALVKCLPNLNQPSWSSPVERDMTFVFVEAIHLILVNTYIAEFFLLFETFIDACY